MTAVTLGTCSICGGRVSVPQIWAGINPPTPTCESCGATKRQSHGPVIDMQPRRSIDQSDIRRKLQDQTNFLSEAAQSRAGTAGGPCDPHSITARQKISTGDL